MKNGNSSDSESKVQKRIKNLSEFNQYADKTSGKLAGNFAGRTGKNNDSKQYMVKPIIDVKNKASNEIMYNWDPDSEILQCIREFLAGDFYRLLLNDQAPIIKLGKNEKDDSYFITSNVTSITPITPTIPVPAPSNSINDAALENHTTPPNLLSNPTSDEASKTFLKITNISC